MAELNFNPNSGLVGSFVDTDELRKFLEEHQVIIDDLKLNLKQLDESIAKNPESAPQLEEMRAKCVEQLEKTEQMYESTSNFLREYQAANSAVMNTVSKLTLGN